MTTIHQTAPTTRTKRKPIKLTFVALLFLAMYTIFVWFVFTTFKTHGSDEENAVGRFGAFRLKKKDVAATTVSTTDASSNNNIGSVQTSAKDSSRTTVEEQTKPKRSTNKASSYNIDEIRDLLSGSFVKSLDVDSIPIERPQSAGTNTKDGLGDIQPSIDVVKSVLSGAKFGDRVYDSESETGSSKKEGGGRTDNNMPQLTAYCEPVNQTDWNTQPLPVREKNELIKVTYPHVDSCSALPSQWPIDNPPTDLDPFLPWIHDVFPSPDGQHVIFVAQNRRRCFNGQRYWRNEELPEPVVGHKGYVHVDPGRNYFMRPQAALMQHVPVKKVDEVDGEPRYRLASHEDADEDGMETRFICRFKLYDSASSTTEIVGYSLSQFELDYDYHTFRKGYLRTHSEAGYDNHVIWTSQLLFKCPIPQKYHEMVANGDTVNGDYSKLFVDVVPIRTAPRYTPPREFLPPRYNFHFTSLEGLFIPDNVWGKEHVLPMIEDSGRWENIPVCMPSLMQHEVVKKGTDLELLRLPDVVMPNKRKTVDVPMKQMGVKIHKVIACTWASATFRTRGNRANVGDGERRLKEWLEFNLLAGFDHIYVYDNSGAFTNENSLADVVSMFPGKVTRVDWPCKICSNLDGNQGERSSQYAAESSCRLRFGVHAKWLGSFDTDEYLVPMGQFTNMGDVSEYLDRKGMYVAVFKSSPAKPRFNLLDNPVNTEEGHEMFTPTVKEDETFLHTYNCNWEQFPRENTLTHRSKQMYRADYIKLHYVHYATVTVVSQMSEEETKAAGLRWKHKYKEGHIHEFFEVNEATMLHTKSKVARNTQGWKSACKRPTRSEHGCNLGFPFPMGADPKTEKFDKDGWAYNCFINPKIESYWWPRLVEAIAARS